MIGAGRLDMRLALFIEEEMEAYSSSATMMHHPAELDG